ncbi:MAG: hypothetical protein ACI3ZK_07665 [Candidatus Cryptobacteroides sp.]
MLNGINWVPSSTLRIFLLLIISVLSIVVVLDVFLEGNSFNLRVACGAVSFIDHAGRKLFPRTVVALKLYGWLRAPTGQNYFRWQGIWHGGVMLE